MDITLQVKPSECDTFGHVNNAVYASYLQYVLAQKLVRVGLEDDWRRDADHVWVPHSMTIEYRQPAAFRDALSAQLWLSEPDPIRPIFGFEIQRPETTPVYGRHQSILRARTAWQRLARETGEPVSLPAAVLDALPTEPGSLPRPFNLPLDTRDSKQYFWEHRVMRAEVGPSGLAHPQAIYQWLEESIFDACDQSGWTAERRLAAGYLVFQTRHDTEFRALPRAGDSVRVMSRVIDVRRLRGTWLQEVHKLPLDDLLIRDYSTGVFVNLDGRPSSPPREMMNEIQFGRK